MRPSKSVLRRHSTVPMCRLPETAHRHSRTSSSSYLVKYTFSLLHCNRRNVQHGTVVILVLVFRESIHFSRRYAGKTIFIFPFPETLAFDLLTSKLFCQLLLTWITSLLSLSIVLLSVFELAVGTGEKNGGTEGQTDRRGVTRNATS